MRTFVYSGPKESIPIIQKMLSNKFQLKIVEPNIDDLYPEFIKCNVFLDASMKVPITADLINKATNLELIITATTGFSHIDHKALKLKGIPLLTLIDQKDKLRDITAAAECSWLLLMACVRRLRGAIKHVEQGDWNRVEFPGKMLKGKTLGIVGVGRIGSWMARYAKAFDMKVVGYDPFQENFPEEIEKMNLSELFKTSDFISIHVNLNDDNKKFISKKLLSNVKKGCIFINTSRSELVDEDALIEGLREGKIFAVGADVLNGEPEISQSLLWQYAKNHDNVIITPHIGGFCPEAVDMVIELSCNRILSYFGYNK